MKYEFVENDTKGRCLMLTKKQLKKLAKDNNLDYDSYHAYDISKCAFERTLLSAYALGVKDVKNRIKDVINEEFLREPFTSSGLTDALSEAIRELETSK